MQLYRDVGLDRLNDGIAAMNRDLESVSEWARLNGLTLNAGKSQAILIYRKSLETSGLDPIVLNASRIEFSDRIRDLGVVFYVG